MLTGWVTAMESAKFLLNQSFDNRPYPSVFPEEDEQRDTPATGAHPPVHSTSKMVKALRLLQRLCPLDPQSSPSTNQQFSSPAENSLSKTYCWIVYEVDHECLPTVWYQLHLWLSPHLTSSCPIGSLKGAPSPPENGISCPKHLTWDVFAKRDPTRSCWPRNIAPRVIEAL